MGVMRFIVEPESVLSNWPEAYGGYVSGADGRVFPTRIELRGNVLSCHRDATDSGCFHVAWPVLGYGRPVLATATLCEREEPYHLAVELARGKVQQLSNIDLGTQVSESAARREFHDARAAAKREFIQAVTSGDNRHEQAQHALGALAHGCRAACLLSEIVAESAPGSPRPLSLGSRLMHLPLDAPQAALYLGAFNAVNVPVEWRMIEANEGTWQWEQVDALVQWARQNRLLIRGGPLFDLSTCGMPAWLWNGPCDSAKVQRRICEFVKKTIQRYLGQIRVWEVAARGNTGGDPSLDEEQRLGLVAYALDIARQVDEEAQFLIRVDQPWGGYQARGQHRLSPLQFVDALLRCGVGLSAVILELTVGYRPRGTASRDMLDLQRLLQQWSALGVPLHVLLACPSGTDTDHMVDSELEVDTDSWRLPWSDEAQAIWLEEVLPILIASKAVNGITWAHFQDAERHEFPHAGLLRIDGSPKPVYDQLAGLHQECGVTG